MIKAVIFDFYGVVCNEIGSPWYKTEPPEEIVSELKTKYDIPSNLGEISEEDFFKGIGESVGLSGETVRASWMESAEINNKIIDLILELKKRYKVAVCSNTQPKMFRDLLKKYDLEEIFDVVVSSSEVGLMKPSPEMYNLTLEKLGVQARDAIFIDDREVNVDGAQNAGIKSFVYTDTNKLISDLINVGIE